MMDERERGRAAAREALYLAGGGAQRARAIREAAACWRVTVPDVQAHVRALQRPTYGEHRADLAETRALRATVFDLLAHRCPELTVTERGDIADLLAHELGFLQADRGIHYTRNPRPDGTPHTGPVPPIADIHFAGNVRRIMREAGVRLTQWRSGRGHHDELNAFCSDLTGAAGLKWRTLSGRSFTVLASLKK